jgi:PAS domain S-box-containing protein
MIFGESEKVEKKNNRGRPPLCSIHDCSLKNIYKILLLTILIFISCASTLFAHDTKPGSVLLQNNLQPLVKLTPAEQAWLKTHPDIVLGYTDAFEPEVIVNQDGTYRGILVDFLDALNKRLGTRIVLRIDPIPKVLERVKTRETDGIASILPEYADKLGLLKTHRVLTGYPAVFSRREVSFEGPSDFVGKKVAIIDQVYFSEEMIRKYEGRITVLKVNDALEGLQSVDRGEVDFFLGASLNAYLITKYQLFGLVPQYVFYDDPIETGMAVRPDWPELVSILNKGVSSFSHNEVDSIVTRWVQLPQKTDVIELTAEERAWLKEHPVITLGGGNFFPLDSGDESGRAEGIGPDYVRLIRRMLGIQFKYVTGDWAKILDMAKEKRIDGIRLLLKDEEREQYLHFTQPYTTLQHAILTQKSSPDINSLRGLSHKRVGTMNAVYAHAYMQKHYPDIELVPYPSVEETLRALVGGEVEAAVASLAVAGSIMDKMFITNLKVTALPPELENNLFVGVRNDWPEFVPILDKAINAIAPEMHLQIKNRWVSRQYQLDNKQIALTSAERVWLRENHVVRVRVIDWPPYFIIAQDQAPQGLAIEYLNLISERTGIKFQYEFSTKPFAEFLENMRQQRGPDMTAAIVRNLERESYLSFSETYLSSPLVLFARGKGDFVWDIGGLGGKTLAVVRGSDVQVKLGEGFPEINLAFFDMDEQALEGVATAKADAYIGNLTVASHIIHKRGFADLRVVAPSPFGDHVLAMGNRKDWPELTSIINKALASITLEEKTAIRTKYVAVKYDTQRGRYSVLLKRVLVAAVVVICILFLFVAWNTLLRKKVRQRTAALENEIAERERAGDALAKSEAQYRGLVDNSIVGVFHSRADGKFVFVNEALARIFDFGSPEEMVGEGAFSRWSDPSQRDQWLAELEKDGSVSNFEMEAITHSGRKIYLLMSSNSDAENISGMIMDITERKQAEQKILDHQQRLKALASQLTLAEERERRRIAADLHDNVGQTLAMSRLQLAAAIKSADDAGLKELLNDLSRTLLKTAKDTRNLIFELSSPAMNEIGLGAAVGEWIEERLKKSHELDVELVDKLGGCDLDQDLRAILFRNVRELLTNTVKHARADKVHVCLEKVDGDIRITVHDNGIGFNPEYVLQNVRPDGGFGLFSIEERMADLGGRFEVKSAPHQGSTFIMSVPCGAPAGSPS